MGSNMVAERTFFFEMTADEPLYLGARNLYYYSLKYFY